MALEHLDKPLPMEVQRMQLYWGQAGLSLEPHGRHGFVPQRVSSKAHFMSQCLSRSIAMP